MARYTADVERRAGEMLDEDFRQGGSSSGRSAIGALHATATGTLLESTVGFVSAAGTDPGMIVRSILRFGTLSASGVDDIRHGRTAAGLAKIVGEMSGAVLMTVGSVRTLGTLAADDAALASGASTDPALASESHSVPAEQSQSSGAASFGRSGESSLPIGSTSEVRSSPATAKEPQVADPNPRDRGQFEKYKTELRTQMERPYVEDPILDSAMDRLYRVDATVGSGSTAAAVRIERATGFGVKGKFHTQKAMDESAFLRNWLTKNARGRPGDVAAA